MATLPVTRPHVSHLLPQGLCVGCFTLDSTGTSAVGHPNSTARGDDRGHLGPQSMVWLLQHFLRGHSCSPAIKSGHRARQGDSARTSQLFHSPLCTSGSCSVTMTGAKFGSVRTEREQELFLLLQRGGPEDKTSLIRNVDPRDNTRWHTMLPLLPYVSQPGQPLPGCACGRHALLPVLSLCLGSPLPDAPLALVLSLCFRTSHFQYC